jgi:hypothetical protein
MEAQDDRLTISDLRRETSATIDQLKYLLSRYGPEPRWRVGITRQWSRELDLPIIRSRLARIARERGELIHA